MFKNFSPSLFFAMAAVTIAIFTPFLMLFIPIIQAFVFTNNDSSSLFITSTVNRRLILLGSIALVGTLGLLAYKRNKSLYMVSSLLIILGIGSWYFSTQNYITINDNHILKHAGFSKHQYQWNQIDDIIYEYATDDKGAYTFTITTGEKFIIKENELNFSGKELIYNFAMLNDIPFTERAK